ncbi:MAG: nucleotide exchange factor GrpE [Nannocystaceae bacterium]|nr:nucleotide exchange factor GrpE [Myxococcales bacterium]
MSHPDGDEAAREVAADEQPIDAEEVEVDELTEALEQVGELEREVASMKDKWLRAVAEHENYKKRVKRDTDDQIYRARQSLLTDFLPTVDNLDRALGLAGNNEDLAKGIKMVLSDFLKALAKHDIQPVPGVGARFDPAVHEALQQVTSPDHAPGVVVMEYEKGFRQGERLIRAARVIIAGPDSTGPEPAEPEVSPDAAN